MHQMVKPSKKLIFITLVLILGIVSPIYAVFRLVVPEVILAQISENLPKGSSISVGEIRSKIDLGIIYKNVELVSENANLSIPEIMIQPVINLKRPLAFAIDTFRYVDNIFNVQASKISGSILLDGFDSENIRIEGDFEQVNSIETAIISHGNFVIAGINSRSKELNLTADTVNFSFKAPDGLLTVKLINSANSIQMDKSLNGQIKSDEVHLIFLPGNDVSNLRNFSGEDFNLNLDLASESDGNWVMPLNFESKNILANNFSIFESLQISAKGAWPRVGPAGCDLSAILSASELCGRMTDVRDVNVLLKSFLSERQGFVRFVGDGFCVAPNSGCRQIINSRLASQDTQLVFSRLLQSEALNPVVLSVLMGMLLGSPTTDGSGSDHSVSLKVNGSQILINETPLF